VPAAAGANQVNVAIFGRHRLRGFSGALAAWRPDRRAVRIIILTIASARMESPTCALWVPTARRSGRHGRQSAAEAAQPGADEDRHIDLVAPGSSRHSVKALRNSVSVSQPRRRTTISCDQAERPPPKLESEMRLKVRARSHRLGARHSPCSATTPAMVHSWASS